MNNFYYIQNDVKAYANALINRIKFLESKRKSLPNLQLKYVRRGNRVQYYYRLPKSDRKAHYISIKNSEQIKKIVNANYIDKVLPKLKENLKAAESFLLYHSGKEEYMIATKMPLELQIQNDSLYKCRTTAIQKWQQQEFVRNPYKADNMIHDTIRGDKVRSKSEAIIANALYNNGLAYHIEKPLKLKKAGRTIYPDFSIIHPLTLEEFYWEHFGMMGDSAYSSEACRRIQVLDSEGYKIGKNLICTFETADSPLSSIVVETNIHEYFL